MTMYLGLDVHCKSTVYVAQDPAGKRISEGRISTAPEGLQQMIQKLEAPAGTTIGLESGTQAAWVYRELLALKMNPVVINAEEVRKKARRLNQKSDRRDAFEICDGVRRDFYTSIVYIPPPEIQRLREILSRRRHFIRLRTAQGNAAKFLLRSAGLRQGTPALRSRVAWDKLLDSPHIVSLRAHLFLHRQIWCCAEEHVRILETELQEALKPFQETFRRLQTVPGVGLIVSASFIAALGTPHRFPDSSHVVSYIGLAPSTYDSGETERHGHITKRGSAEVRAMLCEAAQHTANPHHPLNPYFGQICARHGYKRAVVTLAQRLARILYQMWRKEENFDPSRLNVVADQRVKRRTLYWKRIKTTTANRRTTVRRKEMTVATPQK